MLALPEERAGGREAAAGGRLRGAGRAEGRLPPAPDRGAGLAEEVRGGADRADGRLGADRRAALDGRLALGAGRAAGRLPPTAARPFDGRVALGALAVLGLLAPGLPPFDLVAIGVRVDPAPAAGWPRRAVGVRAEDRLLLPRGGGAKSLLPPVLPPTVVRAPVRVLPARGLIRSEGLLAGWAPALLGPAATAVPARDAGRLTGLAVLVGVAPPVELPVAADAGRRIAVLATVPRGFSL